MTLIAGWSRTQKSPPTAQGTRRDLPAGGAHAVEEGSDTALCGASIVVTGHPWPNVIGSRCRDCSSRATKRT